MTRSGNSIGTAEIEAELRNASVLENAGRLQEALQVYQGLIAEGCELAEVYRRCGRVCWDLQHVDDALAALAKARNLAPDDPRAQVDMAEIKVALNDNLEAEALLQAAQRLAPDDSDIRVKQAILALQKGDRAAARRHSQSAVQTSSPVVGAYQLRGTIAWRDGDLETAVENLGRARKSDPHPADPNGLLASSLFALGRGHEIGGLSECSTDSQFHTELVLQALQAWQNQKLELCRQSLSRALALMPKVVDGPRWNAIGPIFRILLSLMDYGMENEALYQAVADDVVFFVGDSHVIPGNLLPLAFEGGRYRVRAAHIVSAKAWHLIRDGENPQRSALLSLLERLPRGARIFYSFGDQDCRYRGGLYEYQRQHPGADWKTMVEALVEGYGAGIARWSVEKAFKPGLVLAPAPNVQMRKIPSTDRDTFLAIIDHFNDRVRALAKREGYPLLDLFSATFDSQNGVKGECYLDPNHVKPEIYLEAAERIGIEP